MKFSRGDGNDRCGTTTTPCGLVVAVDAVVGSVHLGLDLGFVSFLLPFLFTIDLHVSWLCFWHSLFRFQNEVLSSVRTVVRTLN